MAEASALVFDVQRFSLHDGPGIRTTVFFKGCPLRCRWCQNPESLRPDPEIAFWADRCRTERDCVEACPERAIDPAGGLPAAERCKACGRCEAACAYGARRLIGRRVPVGELLDEALRDQPFFETSGGGITLSGGEPTLQIDAATELARGASESGVSVGLQTCGAFRWERFLPILGALSFLHFDLKAIDPERHRFLTGADNRVILDNARRLAESGREVVFRTPVVPDHTDGEEDLERLARFLLGIGAARIHLLRYHPMGQSKLARVRSSLEPLEPSIAGRAQASLERATKLLSDAGLEVTT